VPSLSFPFLPLIWLACCAVLYSALLNSTEQAEIDGIVVDQRAIEVVRD